MAVSLDDRTPKLRTKTVADRLVLAYLGRLARAGRMARCTADGGVARAIDDGHIDVEVPLAVLLRTSCKLSQKI